MSNEARSGEALESVRQRADEMTPRRAREVLDLYRGPLASVRFPDVDRSSLELAEAVLLEALGELELAEHALERARESVSRNLAALGAHAERALAYARIYASDDPALRERVEAIASPVRPAEAPNEAPRKKGRPRSKAEDGSLFSEEPNGRLAGEAA